VVFSRTFKVALLISTLAHGGTFALLDKEPVADRFLAPPKPALAKKAHKKKVEESVIRFELVETPASAEVSEPSESAKKSKLFSDKNTRAQDRFQGEKKLEDAPNMDGRREDLKDTRPRMIASRPAPPKPEVKPAAKSAPKPAPKPAQKKADPPKAIAKKATPNKSISHEVTTSREAAVPDKAAEKPKRPIEQIQVEPKPMGEEVIRLAKKAPDPIRRTDPAGPSISVAPRMMTAASARNTGADAQITGELSFGTTRHFFGEYLLEMKQAVETEWISTLISTYTGIRRSSAEIDFKIMPDGSVSGMEVSSSEGDPYFPVICMSSIRDAQPFKAIPYSEIPGLPEEFTDKPLSIRFTFKYN
jgi:outer membrane biosynthesis protein TonB